MRFASGVVIPAAGVGSRVGQGVPKALLEIGGKPLINWQIEAVDLVAPGSQIVVVSGFQSDLLAKAVAKLGSNVQMVENEDFLTTGTAHSARLGAALIENHYTTIIPGDLLVSPRSLRGFLTDATEKLGLVPRRTDEPVQAIVDHKQRVIALDYALNSPFELCGLTALETVRYANFGTGYVFHELQKILPLRAELVDAVEVDTLEDLKFAREDYVRLLGV